MSGITKLMTAGGGGVSLTPASSIASDVTVQVPSVNCTLASNENGTLYPLTSGTAVASTSGTSIDFTGIPSWVKRITVMFNGVSTNGSSVVQIQLGDSGGVETTGYLCSSTNLSGTGTSSGAYTAGFGIQVGTSGSVRHGNFQLCLLGSNTWTCSGVIATSDAAGTMLTAGSKALSDTLDRVRITTVNGTDTFDAGSINILYE